MAPGYSPPAAGSAFARPCVCQCVSPHAAQEFSVSLALSLELLLLLTLV